MAHPNISLQSQEFANQVGERQDRIAQTQIGLNLQAGQLSKQAVDSWREGARFQAEQRSDAVNLSVDEMHLAQATQELAWAKELHTVKAMQNARIRDDADTELHLANVEQAKQKLSGIDRVPIYNEDDRLSAIASGVIKEYSQKTGRMELREATAKERQDAGALMQRRHELRYGPKTLRSDTASLEEQRTMHNADIANSVGAPDLQEAFLNDARQRKGLPPQSSAAKKSVAINLDQAQTDASATIPNIGANNAKRAVSFYSQRSELDAIKSSLERSKDPSRKDYHPTDQDALNEMLGILRNPRDPRYPWAIRHLHEKGALDKDEFQAATRNEGKNPAGFPVLGQY